MKKLMRKSNQGTVGLMHGKGGIVAEHFREEAKKRFLRKKKLELAEAK